MLNYNQRLRKRQLRPSVCSRPSAEVRYRYYEEKTQAKNTPQHAQPDMHANGLIKHHHQKAVGRESQKVPELWKAIVESVACYGCEVFCRKKKMNTAPWWFEKQKNILGGKGRSWRHKNPEQKFSGGTLSWGSRVWDFRLVKEPQAWKNRPLSKI